jgi:hypothetical protein
MYIKGECPVKVQRSRTDIIVRCYVWQTVTTAEKSDSLINTFFFN